MSDPEWLAWRGQGVGASDVAAILGISPWASPWSVWATKAGLLAPPEPTAEMEAGHWLELAVGPWFAHRTGLHVAGEQTWCTHPEHAHHRCTVDGFVFESEHSDIADALGVLEIKTSQPGRAWDEVPAHYAAQCLWQMHVTGLDRVWVAVLRGRRLDILEMERDQAEIDFVVSRVDAFWERHVLTGTPPPVDGHRATLDALAQVWPEHTPGKAVDIDDLAHVLDDWRAAKDEQKAAREREKAAAAELIARLEDAEEGLVAGERAVTWRQQSRTTQCAACGHTQTSEFRVLRDAQRQRRQK